MKPLWTCPKCARTFANRNQTHACGSIAKLEAHFERRDPIVREIFDALVRRVRQCGPVTIVAEKTRIAFHVRMSFLAVWTRRDHLGGHFVLARRAEDPRFGRIETFSPRNHTHAFRLRSVEDVDRFAPFIEEAYAVGEQKHL